MTPVATEPIVLGIDLATANARIVAVGLESGTALFEAATPLAAPTAPHPGWSEQAASYAAAAATLIGQATRGLGAAAAGIRALSVTGTSGTVVPCDGAGSPVGPALMYNDQRAADEARTLAGHAANGPSGALARIGWLQRHAPAERYLSTPDAVHAALAGHVLAGDTSHWLKAAIDVEQGAWDRALLEALHIPVSAMADLVQPGTRIGEVHAAVAADLGLPAGVLIIAGMTDGCTAQIGAGAVREGDVVGVLGTTLVLKSVASTNITSPDFVVYSHRSPDGHYWPGGASNVGAGALAARYGSNAEELAAGNAEAARHGVARGICYPLFGTGERFPFVSDTAGFFSIGGDGSRADGYRAIMEGTAFVERLGVEALMALGVQPRRFLATGGGSSSTLWNTIRATVLGHPVHRPDSHNSAFGAALIAAAAFNRETLRAGCDRMVTINDRFDPDPAQAGALEANYQRFIAELTRRGYLPAERTTTPMTTTTPTTLPTPQNGNAR